ncbi:MAG: YihY/virulence factor BrkB family protein [Spirochaetes bacterium]|nr:YihY/virulence factor BrkB family protein [Spirochaetota bacterium]MBU1079188.1 YihY/virulence factor BrkB family protein [Spirochaetota bacterium]
MRRSASHYLKSLTQRILFSLEQFSRHEMANHAAAGAYSFLLSAIPAVLVILFISSRAVASFDAEGIIRLLSPFLQAFGGRDALRSFLSTPLAGFAGAFGFINLVWAARLFIVSIQRGIRVVYSDAAKANPIRENALTFVVELVVIVAVVLIISASQVARAAIAAMDWAPAAAFFGLAVKTAFHALPMASLWLFVFLTYENIPPLKPRVRHAALSSALCVASYTVLGGLLGLTLDTARYGLLYGILGNLIVGLIKVYFFFWLYFFFAEMCYAIEYFDSLLFARFHRISSSDKPAGRIERTLFAEPDRLFKRYAREYAAGRTIFSKGDADRSALYLYRGSVEIYLSPPGDAGATLVSTVEEGEFFGEMAWILEESRSAYAVAKDACTVFVLPPELFERFLAQDAGASRRLVELLAARLKANNDLLSKAEIR